MTTSHPTDPCGTTGSSGDKTVKDYLISGRKRQKALKISENHTLLTVWDHETGEVEEIADTFTVFINSLYESDE